MPKWVKFLTLLVPALMVILSVFMARETWDFQNGSLPTQAVVTTVRFEHGSTTGSDGVSEDTVTYYPTFQFKSATGQEYITESSQPASGFVPEVGDVIPVHYYVENPYWVRPVFSWWTLWAGPMIFAGIGSFFLIVLSVIFRLIERADARRRGPVQTQTVRRF